MPVWARRSTETLSRVATGNVDGRGLRIRRPPWQTLPATRSTKGIHGVGVGGPHVVRYSGHLGIGVREGRRWRQPAASRPRLFSGALAAGAGPVAAAGHAYPGQGQPAPYGGGGAVV